MRIIEEVGVKRRKIIRQIAQWGFTFRKARGPHDVFTLNGHHVSVPRGREIEEMTARKILKDAEGIKDGCNISDSN